MWTRVPSHEEEYLIMFPPVLLGPGNKEHRVCVKVEDRSFQVVPFSQQRMPGIEDRDSSCLWHTERGSEYESDVKVMGNMNMTVLRNRDALFDFAKTGRKDDVGSCRLK